MKRKNAHLRRENAKKHVATAEQLHQFVMSLGDGLQCLKCGAELAPDNALCSFCIVDGGAS